MRLPARSAALLTVLVSIAAAVGLCPPAAHAAGPTLAVSDVTIAPLALRQDSAPDVIQRITWTNLPPGTVLQYRVPQDLGITGFDHEVEYQCGGGSGGFWGQCTNLPASGSGELQVHYSPGEVSADYASCACEFAELLEVRVQELSLDSVGTVTVAGRADLTLQVVTPDQNTVVMTVFDLGPSDAAPSTLTITGFLQQVTLGGGSVCASSGTTITCQVPEIAARAGGGACGPGTPAVCDQITLTFQSGWVPTRLTLRLAGYFADPDPSSNTATAFPDVAPPAAGATTRPDPPTATPVAAGRAPTALAPSAESAGTPNPPGSTPGTASSTPAAGAGTVPAAPGGARMAGTGTGDGRDWAILGGTLILLMVLAAPGVLFARGFRTLRRS